MQEGDVVASKPGSANPYYNYVTPGNPYYNYVTTPETAPPALVSKGEELTTYSHLQGQKVEVIVAIIPGLSIIPYTKTVSRN